jgi:phage terminase Nu1 subunit (DNA packaging protein)
MMNNINKTSTSEQRQRMIQTAAYYRAEKRGFSDGDPVKDWIEAERQIDAAFQAADDPDADTQEGAAYQRLRTEFKKILAGAQGKINADTIRQAFDRAGRELKELGDFVPETVDRAGKRLKQEVAAAVEKMGPRWDAFSAKSHGLFEIWKDKGGQFVNQAYSALNGWVSRYREQNGKGKK